MTLYFEDFHVGQVFETRSRSISEADIVMFSGWSWDTNPVHTDAVSAAGGPFGQRIAHGVLGLSVAMGLVAGTGVFEGSSIALLGIDDWRFVAPMHIGDTVKCRVEITATRLTSTQDRGVLHRRLTLLNQSDETVQAGDIGLMVKLRPTHED
jgi:acyl dehydratase